MECVGAALQQLQRQMRLAQAPTCAHGGGQGGQNEVRVVSTR